MPSALALATDAGFEGLTNFVAEDFSPELARLERMADLEDGTLRAIAFPHIRLGCLYRGIALGTEYMSSRSASRRVCPKCLAISPHHRAAWHLWFSHVCAIHAVELIKTCPDCEKPLRWVGTDLTRCGCGRGDLTQAPVVPIDEAILDGLRAVLGLLGDEAFVSEGEAARKMVPLSDLDARDAIDFLWRLGMDLTTGHSRVPFRVLTKSKSAILTHIALHRGLNAACNWPAVFIGTPDVVDEIFPPPGRKQRYAWACSVAHWIMDLPAHGGHHLAAGFAQIDRKHTRA